MRVHISASNNRLRITLHNLLRRVYYIWKLRWRGVQHKHKFQSWTGAVNRLCWCGTVQRTRYVYISHAPVVPTRSFSLEGEDALRFLESSGSGWVREVVEGDPLDAEEIG